MKISLTAPVVIGGAFRYPSDGVIDVAEAEGARLVEAGLAEDVSAEFAALETETAAASDPPPTDPPPSDPPPVVKTADDPQA